jgi:putative mRNA 3-end processing factor
VSSDAGKNGGRNRGEGDRDRGTKDGKEPRVSERARKSGKPEGRGRRRGSAASAVWRDGVHLVGTPVWCDARRRRDVCFASAHGRVGRSGHGQLIATPATLAMVGAAGAGHLGVPLRRRFTLGTLQLELIPSGHALGAAALRVELEGRSVLYAGAVCTRSIGLAEPGEVRTADCVVVAAPYGAATHVFPPPAQVAAQLVEWVAAAATRGHVLLLVSAELKALDVAAVLASAGIAASAPLALRNLARRARTAASNVPELRAIPRDRPRGMARDQPAVVIATVPQRARLAAELSKRPLAIGWISGEAIDPAAVAAQGVERGFAWSSCADRTQLLAWIEATSAREIYVTGRCAPEIVAHLGKRAAVLGPPLQMRLFSTSEAAASGSDGGES